jgi:hypothetical protein
MKDQRGFYYYPNPANKAVRMYVRRTGAGIEFRMWNQQDPELWKAHGWVPYDAICEAAAMYEGSSFDPARAYDIELAAAVLAEDAGA